ncbi:MAG TPA: hypothetical protein DIW50_12660 [Prolixibacteraceae bacterium]|nr:hypothetical protein [Prolixibacteraceae bacterium]
MSPMALKTRIPDNASGPAIGAMVDSKKQFGETYAGPDNAGKIIELPFGSEIQQLPPQLADAELIQTLKFTREDISAAFGVLLGMIDGSFEKMDVEQLTTLFKNNTMGPIVAIYIAELMCKLLTRDEILSGQSIIFDVTALIGMDYQKMVMSIKEQVVNGMMTPNEGARKLGNTLISGPNGNMHYMQAQYIQLENYEKQNPLQKNDPTTKTQ